MAGSRDILLDGLFELLTPTQREGILQAAVSRVPQSAADLAFALYGEERASVNLPTVTGDVSRLIDLTLLMTVNDEILVHTWIGEAIAARHGDRLSGRHDRAYRMRVHRLAAGRFSFPDTTEIVRHLKAGRHFDEAARYAGDLSAMMPTLEKAAILAEATSGFPRDHRGFPRLLDLEVQALVGAGESTAALARAAELVEVARASAASHPGDVSRQHDLVVAHQRAGEVARSRGDIEDARLQHEQALVIAQDLVRSDPGDQHLQHALGVVYSKLAELARDHGDASNTETLDEQAQKIWQQLAQSIPLMWTINATYVYPMWSRDGAPSAATWPAPRSCMSRPGRLPNG